MVKRFLLALLLVLVAVATSDAVTLQSCHPQRLTSNGATTRLNLKDYAFPVAAWLAITNAGSGTPSVAVNIYGPTLNAVTPSALLCTMSASVTYCGLGTNVMAVDATVTGCTGTCDLTISYCGVRLGP